MQLVRYNPQREMTRLERDLDKLLRDTWDWTLPTVFHDVLTVDMYTEKGKLVVEATLPGFTKEEVKLNVSGNTLDIAAEHAEKEETEARREYLLHETKQSYHRLVTLPNGVKADEAEADFTDGTLKVTIPMEKPIESKEVVIK